MRFLKAPEDKDALNMPPAFASLPYAAGSLGTQFSEGEAVSD